ncbi:sensor histidine kinase [Actinomycetospora rhizophila]|uniref:histidine kinase n=1 Tax=Actinomycetospora rhizophila TaxID=1416876 RepID=A0ABV9Z9G5_9PSEU
MRRRIVVLAVAAAGMALLLFGAPLAVGLLQFALTEERIGLQRLADSTAWSIQERMSHGEVPTVLPAGPADVAVALYGVPGGRLAGEGPPWIDRAVQLGPDDGAYGGDGLVVVSPVSDTHDVVGIVRVAGSPASVYAALVPWWLAMTTLAMAVLVAVWFVARQQARRLSQPLEVLAVDAERLGNGDFSVRCSAAGVDEVDHVVRAVDATARRLDEMLARERAFSAEASHQLRTPLTGLRLRLEAALDGPDDITRSAIESGLTSIDRLERTIDDLLVLARERRDHAGTTDVVALARDAEREWGGRLTAEGRRLELRIERDVPAVAASPAAARQVLGVLLDNARAHGTGRVRVTVREIDESAVACDVADEGEGVTPEILGGAQARTVGSSEGQGIGLALAQRLATAEGGRLVVKEPGTVSLLLPVHGDRPTTPDRLAGGASPSSPTPAH